ncbi:hypothetical protein [Natronococcus sp. A-GB7]|uniref:hypothetical protein n=1 Tax=Natronococcus sp. A-GB7 TaxID=3037649 RepID=UPI00241D5A74|nr:hypothetical protein [Natronococcus sp. A-GB7]MDG5821893.1 hypothetical protein [Natronococcus sp. A-GB7]
MSLSPDYGTIDIPDHIDEVVSDLQNWIDGRKIDVLTVNRCDEDAVIEFLKNMSKLSSLMSVQIETRALKRVQSIHGDELPDNVGWVINERIGGEKYPDLALADFDYSPSSDWVWPGVEIKAWCPFATEMSGRMMKGQSIMQKYPDQLLLVAWLPEHLLYGQPKVIGTWVGDGLEMAKSRDNYWHNPPSSLILEPDFSPEREAHKQHTNVDRYLWDDDSSRKDEAEKMAKELELYDTSYSFDADYQQRVRELYSSFNYKKGTNFRKLTRLHHTPLDTFPDNIRKNTTVEGKTLAEWNAHLKRGEAEPFKRVLNGSQTSANNI